MLNLGDLYNAGRGHAFPARDKAQGTDAPSMLASSTSHAWDRTPMAGVFTDDIQLAARSCLAAAVRPWVWRKALFCFGDVCRLGASILF